MKKFLRIVILGLLLSGSAYADSTDEILTRLNEIYKEGAISKEQFSKAKSILLELKIKEASKILEMKINEVLKDSQGQIEEKKDSNVDLDIDLTKEEVIKKVKEQIFGCWSIPIGLPYNENLLISIKVKLEPDGTVSETEILNMPSQDIYKVLAESALRAIKLCQPLRVPNFGYESWKEIILNFDAREFYKAR